MLQILLRNVGNKTETGLSNKQTLFNLDKPIKAFLLKETILFDSKLTSYKFIKPLKTSSSIRVILLFCKDKYWREERPLKVAGSMKDIWLLAKSNSSREDNSLNVVESMDDIWLPINHKSLRVDKPLKVAGSIDDTWLPPKSNCSREDKPLKVNQEVIRPKARVKSTLPEKPEVTTYLRQLLLLTRSFPHRNYLPYLRPCRPLWRRSSRLTRSTWSTAPPTTLRRGWMRRTRRARSTTWATSTSWPSRRRRGESFTECSPGTNTIKLILP